MSQPKVLIIAAQPYNKTNQSRSYDSFFHQFDKENLAQVFSDARTPCKGHCAQLFQITDKSLIKRRFSKRNKVGRLFHYDDLPVEWIDQNHIKQFKPKKKGPIYRFLRKFIWNKKYWDTPELEKFVSDFRPDCLFLAFSKDFFVFDIAIHFAKKYGLPIIVSIMDDYFFYDEFKGKPFNKLYKKKFDGLIADLMKMNVYCVFESEKIKEKYVDYFGVPGQVIYIASNIQPVKAENIDLTKDWYYFGNLEYGRFDSLQDIARVLRKYIPNIKVHIYTPDIDAIKNGQNFSNIVLHAAVPYAEMLELAKTAGVLLIVESFKENYVKMVEYSLSTKVGDSLCLGRPVLAYGHQDAGAISFLNEEKCCYVATNIAELEELISKISSGFNDESVYEKQLLAAETYFCVDKQSRRFLRICETIRNKSDKIH